MGAEAFGTVIVIAGCLLAVAAVLSLRGHRQLYRDIGKGGLSLEEPDMRRGPEPGSVAARAEAAAEIRQLVEAKSARREARGEAPLDVEAEIAALTGPPPGTDEMLREEVRQLVVARNERRVARGQAPLDVEEEITRQITDAGG